MAAGKPTDRIRDMVRELERAARSMGDDLRERAGKAGVPPDLEAALRQVLQGLTNITAQIEKAVGELRRYLEANAKTQARQGGARRKAGKATKAGAARKKTASKASAKTTAGAAGKAAGATTTAARKKAAKRRPAKKSS